MRRQSFTPTLPNEIFSKREIEILALIADGLSNQELAGKIFLSLGTIKWYNKQIFRKLGVSSRTHAIAKARELGFFEDRKNTLSHEEIRPKHNLPFRLSSYIGRTVELADLLALLQRKSRLVTIIGTGGIGKTTLALRVAEESLGSFMHGIWFVDLAPLADPALVEQAIAHVLEIRDEPGVSLHDLVVRYLDLRKLLLVLDNCEHLLEACAELASSLLKACPDLQILATSREALRVPGEMRYPLDALPFPDPGQTTTLETFKQYDAVQLFSQRAGLVSPGFKLTLDNARAVGQLCQRLDGLPLALELAAACVNLLSVTQIVDHLDALLWKLAPIARWVIPRHRSLQACLDWSYSLLSEPERILLQRLSVFVGGWTLEAAVEVCADLVSQNQLTQWHPSTVMLDLLGKLVNKSLVVAHMPGDAQTGLEMRYHLLDTIHQYAQERLTEAGEVRILRDRHLTYFRKFSEQAEPKLRSAEQPTYLGKLEAERVNLHAAMGWALAENLSEEYFSLDRLENGLRLGNALLNFWDLSSPLQGDLDWLRKGLERINPQDERWMALRARTLFTIGSVLSWEEVSQESRPCLKVFEESIFYSRACGDLPCLSMALAKLAWMSQNTNHTLALSLAEESVAICRRVDDRWYLAEALWHMMGIADAVNSLACGQECLALFRETGDAWRINWTLANLSGFSIDLGHYAAGNAYMEESTRFFRERGSLKGIVFTCHIKGFNAYKMENFHEVATNFGIALESNRQRGRIGFSVLYLWMLGTAYLHLGDFNQSAGYFFESLSVAKDLGDIRAVGMALSGLAGVATAVKQPLLAIHLMGAVDAAFGGLKETINWIAKKELDRNLPFILAQLDQEAFTAGWAEGRGISLEMAIIEAFAITV